MYHASGPYSGPAPICFKCGQEGHYVVDCPQSRRITSGGPSPSIAQPNFSSGNSSGNQAPQWSNGRRMGGHGAIVTQYPKAPPVVTRFAVPGQAPQYGGSYVPIPSVSQYQPGSAPPAQSYQPPSQGSYANQQYGYFASSYAPNPSQHTYSNPQQNTPYLQGYQAPPYGQYSPSNGPPQHNRETPQQYGSPAPTQYQSPINQFPSRDASFSGTPRLPHWNKTTPVSTVSPFATPVKQQQQLPPIQQRRDSSVQREFSETPSQQLRTQPTPQNDHAQSSDAYHKTPKTPSSGYNMSSIDEASQDSPTEEVCFPPKSVTESVASSRASTPFGRYAPLSDAARKSNRTSVAASPSATEGEEVSELISISAEAILKQDELKEEEKDGEQLAKKEAEEGEYTEEDRLQDEFNWEYKKIFKEPQGTESVALSQPLSYTYNVTPVPLLDQTSTASVSRYARNDNLKDYTRPIRSQSQWDYLKEDPAFSDTPLTGPLIPLKDARRWMDERHGIEQISQPAGDVVEAAPTDEEEDPYNLLPNRKRAWSHEQEDVDNQIQLEVSVELIAPTSKRPKYEQLASDESLKVKVNGSPNPGTPIIGRSGTPTFGIVDDDAWAPEPGEAASAPMDPTEALLASLGVSGTPKPVKAPPDPLVGGEDVYMASSYSSIPQSMSPQAHLSDNNGPCNNTNGFVPTQEGNDYGNPQYATTQHGAMSNSNVYGPLQANAPFSNHGLPAFNNNVPLQSAPISPYGAPQQYPPYANQGYPQQPPPYSNPQYTAAQGQHPQPYLTQQPQYPIQGQFVPPQPQYGGPPTQFPPQTQYGPPLNQYGPPQASYGYNGPPQNQYVPPQGNYGPPQAQWNGQPQGQFPQPQGQWSPLQGQYNNGHTPNQGPGQQYGTLGYGLPQGPPMQGDPAYGNPQQQGGPQAFNDQGLPRQDSGYISARGSYSNGTAPNGNLNGRPPQQGQHQTNGTNGKARTLNADLNGDKETLSTVVPSKKKEEAILDHESPKDNEPVESPLSPTSKEILGKLTTPVKPRKIIRVISGKNKGDSPSKKEKRPAPVVAEAYSRRW